MTVSKELSGLHTKDGKNIYTLDYVNSLRQHEEGKRNSKVFIPQSGPQEDGLHQSVDILVYGGSRGGGKANPYSTLVCTPAGKRRMGQLSVGDLVCTPYEGPQRIENIYEQGYNTIYRVHFNDNTYVDCMDTHLFYARQADDVAFDKTIAAKIFNNYEIGQLPPNAVKKGCVPYEVPLCGEVEMMKGVDEYSLPIHPYTVGTLLSIDPSVQYQSDGFWLKGCQKFTGWRMASFGYSCRRKNGCSLLRGITKENFYRTFHARRNQLSDVEAQDGIKRGIPNAYKTASVSARWNLIQGLLSTHSGQLKKHPYFATPSRQIAEDLADVARSLGGFATVSVIEQDRKPERIGWFRVWMIFPDDRRAFYSGGTKVYMQENAVLPTKPTNMGVLTKTITWIEQLPKKENCRCITISGRDHLYLTDGYTINHNTWTLMAEPLYDVHNPNFNGIIFRKNKDDFDNIINESSRFYKKFGRYNRSADDMTWYFHNGGQLSLSIYEMAYQKFDDKYRGQQYSYIGIDELPQMSFKRFKFLLTCNRNVFGIKSRMIGTCNPDPYSWLRVFISWYLDEEGYVIPERSGKIRYFYSGSDNVEEVVWGNTPEEVYAQCRQELDARWDPSLEQLGYNKETFFVKSFSFIKADLKYNKILLKNDKGYLAGLLNQSEATKARELDGCWNPHEVGNDLIKVSHMEQCFHNDEMTGDGIRRASCDVAFTGGDNCVMWLWIGWHLADVFVCQHSSVDTCNAIAAKLQEWGVTEDHFTYDLNGLGQTFRGFFKHAVPFNNVEAVGPKYKNLYDNIKSQCAYLFAQKIINREISFSSALLDMRFSGKGFDGRTLHDILLAERRAIAKDEAKADKGWCLIKKDVMKRIVGHSPDFIEALIMRMYFEIRHTKSAIPSWVSNL